MNEQSAKSIIRCGIRTMALLNQLVDDLQKTLSAEEFDYQRRVIGNVMGQVGTDLINPMVSIYPEMNVDDAAKWRSGGGLDTPNWIKPKKNEGQ